MLVLFNLPCYTVADPRGEEVFRGTYKIEQNKNCVSSFAAGYDRSREVYHAPSSFFLLCRMQGPQALRYYRSVRSNVVYTARGT